MRSLGAIVVGIGAYRYERERFPLLRCASKDASEFYQYLATCWPKPDQAKVIRVSEESATEKAITNAFSTLGQEGPYDLQLVFVSGHGLVNSETAGFVVQPPENSSALAVLETTSLDRLLATVPAKRTILILDCCYAEGITKRMAFFRGLGEDDARLFVASSRESQLTWEDERVGHGIFTAHLLDLLRTGSSAKLKGVRDQLDVDSELFPVLCEQVPLYVFEHKQKRQEPVKGGVSIRAVTLPVARAARRIKERTALGTAVRRIRQTIAGGAIFFLGFLFLAYTLSYYAEADRNGNVRLHHGTKWLAPVLRFLPAVRTDTGISSADLSDDPASRYAVQAGDTAGFWTQLTKQGYRAWYDTVRPSLDPKAISQYDLLVATGSPLPVFHLNENSRPSETRFAAWALLDHSESNQVSAVLAHVLGADRTSPLLTAFSVNDLDFNVLDLTQPELASFADALRFAASVDPNRTFIAYLGFLKANQIWLAHSSREQHGEEAQRRAAEDVADVLRVIEKARADRGEAALDPNMISQLNGLNKLGYGRLVDLALSRASRTPENRSAGVTKALSAFHGDTTEPTQAAALRELKDLLDSTPSSEAAVAEVYKRFVAMGGAEQSDLTGFLIAAADRKALPPAIIQILLDSAQKAVARRDREFLDTEHARILAHAMSQVPTNSRPLVYQLIEAVAADVTPMASSTAEIYTALGRQHLDTPAMFQRIVVQAHDAPPYQPQDPGVVAEPLPGLSIVVGHGPWLEALAVLAQDRRLDGRAIEILEKHANDPSLHDVIVRALASQPAVFETECWKTSCGRMLNAFPNDAAERQLASDVLAERLASLPRGEFLAVLDRLRREREVEVEPEVRIAIALARINGQLARVRTTPIGSQLFESNTD